jgi:hypothetical protein
MGRKLLSFSERKKHDSKFCGIEHGPAYDAGAGDLHLVTKNKRLCQIGRHQHRLTHARNRSGFCAALP